MRPNKKQILVVFSWLWLCAQSTLDAVPRGSQPNSTVDVDESFLFQHLSKTLSYNTGECILQDHEGFLWIGTPKGLNRYDGIDIKRYEHNPADSASLSNDHIRKIAEDREGNLWIATENGLNRYDRDRDAFVRFFQTEDDRGISSNNVSDVLVDRSGRIWIAADALCLFHPETGDFTRYRQTGIVSAGNPPNYHNFVYEDKGSRIWYGCWRELFVFNPQSQKLESFFNGNLRPLGNEFWNFQEMLQDDEETFWVATNQAGLLKFKFGPGEPELRRHSDLIGNNDRLSRYRLLALFIDKSSRLWVSMEDNGLVVFDRNGNIQRRFMSRREEEHSISGNSCWCIYQDRQDRLWFGTWMAGVDFIDPNDKKFSHYHGGSGSKGLSSDIVTAFLEDERGNIWIATDGGGLNCFNRQNDTFQTYRHDPKDTRSLSSNAVLALCYDDSGNLWAGTWNGGINILNGNRNGFSHLDSKNSGLLSNHIFALLNDGQGKIAVGTYGGGVSLFDMKSGHWETYQYNPGDDRSLQSNNIFTLHADRKGGLWVGTLSDGLALLERDAGGFTRFQYNPSNPNGLSDNRIQSMYEDDRNRFWIGTSNGLNLLDRETATFRVFRKDDGLPSDFIQAISGDAGSRIWISTLGGMTRFDPGDSTFRSFDRMDDLPGSQFNLKAVYRTRDGEMLFGGIDGFYLFHPDSIRNNPHPPQIVLTDFKIFNKSVPIGGKSLLKRHISECRELTLSYRESVFSFEFAALNLTHPEKNRYAYKMEGFETAWNDVGVRRNATYTNLNPGNYVFRVRAANNDGVWNEEDASIRIHITPPFWKTRLAFALYAAFGLGGFYLIMRTRLRRQKQKHDLEMEHLQFERLIEADKMKSRFFSNVSHELRTPIMLILGPLEHLIHHGDLGAPVQRTLEMTVRNARRLSRLLNQFIAFYRMESSDVKLKPVQNDIVQFVHEMYLSFLEYAKLHRIDFQFHGNIQYGLTWFDPDALDKMLYNLLSNAFKFTPDGGKIGLSLDCLTGEQAGVKTIRIRVTDSGIGIPADRLDRIFELYYQIDPAAQSKVQGLGIGLHLTRELTELHQGSISVESREGHGTTFTIQIPVDVIVLDKPEGHDEMVLSSDPTWMKNGNLAQRIGGEYPEKLNDETVKSTALILVVDDDPDVHRYIHGLFDPSIKILSAHDGAEGVEKAVASLPDLIISDLEMPGLNGYDLCQKIKREERTSHIPILLLTVHSEQERKIKGIQAGADDYLPKPFDAKELKARVFNLLETRKKLREHFRRQVLLEPKDVSVLSLDERFLLKCKQVVENRISDWKLDADGLSREVGISRTQLYRKVKSLTGQTVHEFIRTLRLKRAATLLENRNMKISEIAYHVGFNDLNYFSRCFRKQFGKSPSEYVASKFNIDLPKS